MGAGLVAVPESVRFLAASPGAFRRANVLLSLGLATLVIAWGAVALLLPESLGTALLGENWEGARNVVLPLTIVTATYAGSYGAMVGLRALAAARRSLRARSIVAVLTVLAGVIGAALAGARGVAWGFALVGCVELFVWWWHFTRATDEHPGTKGLALKGRQRPWDRRRGRPPSGGEE